MTDRLQLKIISATGRSFEVYADSVILPAKDGAVGILPNHTQMLAALIAGKIKYRSGSETKSEEIGGGIAEIKNNVIFILEN